MRGRRTKESPIIVLIPAMLCIVVGAEVRNGGGRASGGGSGGLSQVRKLTSSCWGIECIERGFQRDDCYGSFGEGRRLRFWKGREDAEYSCMSCRLVSVQSGS